MMESIFLRLLNMSIASSWLILAVIVLRMLLRKAPKTILCALWALIAIRLVCPFSVESAWSLIPSSETIPQKVLSGPSFDVNTGIDLIDAPVNDYLGDHYSEGVTVSANYGRNSMAIRGFVWIAGVIFMLLYAVISYMKLRKKVSEGVELGNNVWLCDRIDTPFILGIVRPRIFLPSAMDDKQQINYVVEHEKAHLARHDHWWKPLGFVLLAVYWFNPLCWVSFWMLCKDMELACDEKVIKNLDEHSKKVYSETLLTCSVTRNNIVACPLAFGEVGVQQRIKNILNYKKPAFWIVAFSIVACVVITVCFLTNPIKLRFDFENNSVISATTYDSRESSANPYENELSERQICILISMLDNISWVRNSDEYAGQTPSYSISAKQVDGTLTKINGYASNGRIAEIVYNEKRYVVKDYDFAAYVSNICAGIDTTNAMGITNNDEALLLLLSFENYSNIYVHEAEDKDYGKPEKSFRDVVSQYNWEIIKTEVGEIDPRATIILNRADGMHLFIWGDSDVILITDGRENGGTAVSCGKSIIDELLPWAKAEYTNLLEYVKSASAEDIPSFIEMLPKFSWSAYVKANGETDGGDLMGAFYTYVTDHKLNRTQYSHIMQGTNGLDGAYAEGFGSIIDILERDPYTLVWCYDQLSEEKQAAILPFIVWEYRPESSQETVLAWMDDVREQLSIAEEIPLTTDTGDQTEFAFDMGDGVTLGITTYSGGLPISLSGFRTYIEKTSDGKSSVEASCNSLGLLIRAGISSTGDYSPWEVSVNTPAYPTVSGVAVGDEERDIIAAYGNNLQRLEGEGSNKQVGVYDLRYVYAGEQNTTMTFYLYEGKIYLIVMERQIW